MKFYSATWRQDGCPHRAVLSVDDATKDGKLRRIRINSYLATASHPKDNTDDFMSAIESHLGEGLTAEEAVARAEAEHPVATLPHPPLLGPVIVLGDFDKESEILRQIGALVRGQEQVSELVISSIGPNETRA
jgi:hypothetical protein